MPRKWKRFLRIAVNSFRHRRLAHLWAYYVNSGRSFNPRRINLEVSYQCNLRCKMCLLHNAGHLRKMDNELSLEEIADFVHSIKRWRPSIGISGGEPFVRKDILKIIGAIKKENLACDIITNGTLMNEDHCLKLVDLGLEAICFSIDGIDDVHDDIRGAKDSYRKAVSAITYLNRIKKEKKSKTPNIFINCVIMKDNMQNLEKMVEVAKELKVGLQYQHVMFLEPEAISQHKQEILRDFPDKNDEFLEGFAHSQGEIDSRFLAKKVSEVYKKAERLKQVVNFLPDLRGQEIVNYYSMPYWWHSSRCFSPWVSLTVSPYGDVYPCLQLKMGNIRDKSLGDIWNGDIFQQFRNRIKRGLLPRCRRCCHLGSI